MTYHVQFLLLVRQPLFDRAALLLTQTSWVLPPLSVGKMALRLYGALNYSHGLSKGPSFGTGRGCVAAHGYFNFDREGGGYEIHNGGKPATTFLFKLISELQFSGTVPMIDVQAYAEWLSK